MADLVVDPLEPVDIEEGEGRAGARKRRENASARSIPGEGTPVQHPGQRVAAGQRLEFGDPPPRTRKLAFQPQYFPLAATARDPFRAAGHRSCPPVAAADYSGPRRSEIVNCIKRARHPGDRRL
ncbi:MAG: hypothetical protein R3D02_02175 [Hyphomicrobiales bacterium]